MVLSCCAGAEPRHSLGQQPGLTARSCSVFWGQGLRGLSGGTAERAVPAGCFFVLPPQRV